MGGFNPFRQVRKVAKKVTKVAKKVAEEVKDAPKDTLRVAKKAADETFEELIEKPVKKVATETFDIVTGMDKEERRTLLYGDPQTPQVTEEVTPEVVPDDETLLRDTRRTRGKRSGQGGTLVGGYGALYRKGVSKSATGE